VVVIKENFWDVGELGDVGGMRALAKTGQCLGSERDLKLKLSWLHFVATTFISMPQSFIVSFMALPGSARPPPMHTVSAHAGPWRIH